MDLIGYDCAYCGMPVENGKFKTSKDFGSTELYFCNEGCKNEYYKVYGHLAHSTKFMNQISTAQTEVGKAVQNIVLNDVLGVNYWVKQANDAGFGALTGLVGSGIHAISSPEAKARRAAKQAEREQKQAEELQKRLKERRQEFFSFDPNGKFRDVKEMTTFAVDQFKTFVTEDFSSDYLDYFMSSISQIRRVCVNGIEAIKKEKPALGEKLQKKYDKILGHLAVKNEIDYIQQRIGGNVAQVQAQQQALKDNLAYAKKALPLYKFNSMKKNIGLSIKSCIPFLKVTKEDVQAAKAERIKNIEALKVNLSNAKDAIANNMKNLKKEEARLKKEGDKELAAIRKVLRRFKWGIPKSEQLEHALNFAKENNI
ncbi:hypothetical protein [Treponema sp.]|uniref:hypothetical protein n=1 Tax=Treponema sp. TaxID=166 RepID=UPI00298D98DE|nr:hypothetical protein [Treponema sp.]MCQ2240118.1 hypothetical protein [Treponema sp.]